jgi:hypothetical protein
MSTTATLIRCPGKACAAGANCAEQVVAHGLGDFAATQVAVEPCTSLVAQGWTGPQLVEFQSRAGYLVPQVAPLQHREGLVIFG